jgi:hypothetical protein
MNKQLSLALLTVFFSGCMNSLPAQVSEWILYNVENTGLPEGIYFYRLQTGQNTLTKKMILIR